MCCSYARSIVRAIAAMWSSLHAWERPPYGVRYVRFALSALLFHRPRRAKRLLATLGIASFPAIAPGTPVPGGHPRIKINSVGTLKVYNNDCQRYCRIFVKCSCSRSLQLPLCYVRLAMDDLVTSPHLFHPSARAINFHPIVQLEASCFETGSSSRSLGKLNAAMNAPCSHSDPNI